MTSNHLLLYRLAELMLEHEQHIISVDLLFDDEHIGDFVKSIQIDSPYQQMLLEGVLTESVKDEKLFVSYTVEGYFHYILGEVIYIQTEGKKPVALKNLIETNKLNGVKEGVEQSLIRDIVQKNISSLIYLIDTGGSCLEICSMPLAIAFDFFSNKLNNQIKDDKDFYAGVNFVFENLFDNFSENDIIILEKAIDYLKLLKKNNLITEIYQKINENIKPDNLIKANLYVKSIKYISENEKITKLNALINYKYFEDDNKKASIFYDNIAHQFQICTFYDEALKFYEKSWEILGKIKKINKRTKLNYLLNKGAIFHYKKDYDKSIECTESALAISLSLIGDHYGSKSNIYHTLGVSWLCKKNYDKAFENLELAISLGVKEFGYYDSRIASYFLSLASIMLAKKNYLKAKEFYLKTLEIRKKTFGELSSQTAKTIEFIGFLYFIMKDYDKSIENYEYSLSIFNRIHPKNNLDIAKGYIHLGEVWQIKKDFIKAIDNFEKALSYNFISNNDIQEVINLFNNLGLSYKSIRNYSKGIYFFEQALELVIKIHGFNSPDASTIYFNLGLLFKSSSEYEKAIISFKNGFNILNKAGFPFNIAECYEKINQPETALEFYITSAILRKENKGISDVATLTSMEKCINLAKNLDKYELLPNWIKDYNK